MYVKNIHYGNHVLENLNNSSNIGRLKFEYILLGSLEKTRWVGLERNNTIPLKHFL